MSAENRQLLTELDREKAETLGVPVSDVYDTLQTLFGSLYVNQFPKNSRLWQVILQAEPEYRLEPEDIDHIYVRSDTGSMVPLSALVKTRWSTGPDLVTRFNNYPAAKITGGPAPGVSSGQALEIMEQIANEVLPGDYGFAWAGEAREEKHGRRHVGHCLHLRPDLRVPDPRRPVRELDAAVRGYHGGALRPAGGVGGDRAARTYRTMCTSRSACSP